ncbi:GNAT family N-acetyltransferase [Cellulosimicrobium sp. CUA-896]|uniref:GNAT family N-acetyltransferase n=1 Tax=Cellulosimicrobium sp. CUA-896 TaxID=1517881 RepID=UPI00095B71C1|nr:GNAT family N-acetyltransferase [Cellulosimicrobium sp. CUA-896]OLT51690.1 GNAT family N-acetyltransferase [Cellulosimicrobium sp. CUA-896]
MDHSPPPAAGSPASVRPAVAADLGRVAEIFAPYARDTAVTFETEPWDVARWAAKHDDLAGRGLPFLVADVEGEVAGFAYAGPWRPKAAYRHTVEDTIYLDPGYAGQGVGTVLLTALLDAAARAGARQVVSVVADVPEAAASLPLHRRLGFVEAGRLTAVGFKHGRWVDTVLLQRALDSPA